MTSPCHSPYCECAAGKCSHPGFHDARHEPLPESAIDFEADTPLVCSRDQSGDTACESCQ